MSFIDLNSEYIIGIKSIDDEHSKIAAAANTIFEYAVKSDINSIKKCLPEFLNLLKYHFANEELLMKENNFPGYYSHKLEHGRFYRQISDTAGRYINNEELMSTEELSGIRRWFFNHIEIKDRICGQFLKDK